jgi:alkylation response protein AidB-like acyl-CoA dehydrogenase
MRATGSDAFVATDLFDPEHHAITLPRGKPRETGTLFTFSPRWSYACGFASVALGVARSLLDAYADLAANKIPRAASRVLRENAVVQADTGRAEARLRAARAFVQETLREVWQSVDKTHALQQEQRVLLRLATTHAMNEAVKVANAVHQAAGATAIDEDAPFARPYRDMHALKQHLQANVMHYEYTGQYFLGLDPDMTWM